MPEPTRLHIIDPSEALQRALVACLRAAGSPFRDGTVSTQWLAMHDWDYAPSVVVVRASIRDVWPIQLKVRALAALRCRTVVLLDVGRYPRAVTRLEEAGAWAIVDTDSPLTTLVAVVDTALRAPGPAETVPSRSGLLPDRPLQVAALYSSLQAPTTPQIAQALGLSKETVRTHLERARTPFRRAGVDVSTRDALRQALHDDGHLVGNVGWFA